MSQTALADYDWDEFIENLQIEDDEPVDNIITAKQMRLLVETLYTSWSPLTDDEPPQKRKFFADADVGIFYSRHQPPIVPDVFVSLDIEANPNFQEKKNRSYFVWEFEKSPEVAIEIVSNKIGNELGSKMKTYGKIAVSYYVVFDPLNKFGDELLRVYELAWGGRRYHLRRDLNLPDVGLSLILWKGKFEGIEYEWLRWCDAEGNLLLTGKEHSEIERTRAEIESQRAETEKERAEIEHNRAETEKERADKLAAKLREMGVNPEEFDK